MTDNIIDRRAALRTAMMVAAAAGVAGAACSQQAETAAPAAAAEATPAAATPVAGIVLYCDLKVDPAKEQAMLDHFHNVFAPAGAKFDGFVDVKMVKLRTIIQGPPLPEGINYRFQLSYVNEELRQLWVNSQIHTDVWAGIDAALLDKNFHVSLFDIR